MLGKYRRGTIVCTIFITSISHARSYPIQEVSVNNCIVGQEVCKATLPHIDNAQYDTYKSNPLYRRIYTMLRGTTYDGERDTQRGGHQGVDIATEPKTPVYAIQDGVVIFAGRDSNRGNVVVVQHDYNGKYIYSVYAHLGVIFVQKGDTVTEQQNIAEVGDSGNTSGPHLHFQIDTNQEGVHPFFYSCPGSITDIVNNGLCRNQMIANTIDPIAFIEQQLHTPSPKQKTSLIFDNFIGGYSKIGTLEFLNIKNDNLDTNISPVSIKFDKDKLRIFPTTIDFVGSQRTIYIRSIQTGFTTIDFIQDNTIIKRIPVIIGEDNTFRIDNQTITTLFEKIPLH